MSREERKSLEDLGITVVTTMHALGDDVNEAFRGDTPNLIVRETLYRFCQGMKVAVEISLMAADAGRIGALAGDLAGGEEIFALKDLMGRLGVASLDCRQRSEALDPALGRGSYIFNPGVAAIEEADAIMLIGTNPRLEAAVLNGRIRKRWREGGLLVGVIGAKADL